MHKIALSIISTIALSLGIGTNLVSKTNPQELAGGGTVINSADSSFGEPLSNYDFNFNFGWKFSLDDVENAQNVSYDDSSWRVLDLPHDWSVEQDFDSSIPAAMGKLPAGIGWYRKSFNVPSEYLNKDIYINFDGAYMNSSVYLNGHLLGNYPYGYTPFSYKLNDYLVEGENTIAVRIDSPLGNGRNSSRWYAGAGINRNVTLSFDNPVHFVKDGIQITDSIASPNGDKSDFRNLNLESSQVSKPDTTNVKTTLDIEIENTTSESASGKIIVSLLDYNTKEVIETWEQSIATLEPNKINEVKVEHTLTTNVKLWDVENPNLYLFKVESYVNDELSDVQEIRYGFRNVLYTKKGFYLNGEYTKLQGACMHHDQGSLGAVSYKASVERQMRIMKEMGVNAIRTSHNTPTSEFLEACDELGLLVMEEFFDTWTTAKNTDDYHLQFEEKVPQDENHPLLKDDELWSNYDIRMSVRRDRNYPSVIMYSVGNEIYDTNNGQWSVDTVKRLIGAVHEEDTTKAITMGFPMWHGAGSALDNVGSWSSKVADELDLVGLNYPGSTRYEDYASKHPNWIVFGSENSSAWKSRGVFASNGGQNAPGWDRQISSLDFYNHFAKQADELKWDKYSDYSLGEFIWTGFDYIGEPQPYDSGSNSAKSSYYGSVDTAGFPKAEYYMLKAQWTDDPFIKIVNNINLDDDTLRAAISRDGGESIELWVATNQKTVELFYVDEDGTEHQIESAKERDQRSVQEAGKGSSTHEYLQEPLGNPDAYKDKLYQVFTVNYEEVKGKKVIAKAYDVPSNELEGATPTCTDEVSYSFGDEVVKLTPEKHAIKADGLDLAYISVDITDKNGNFSPLASNEVYFSIEGDGEIIGVDNGDATSTERYKAGDDGVWKRTTFNGKALVIVRSTREAGQFTITARSEGLSTASTTVLTIDPNSVDEEVQYISESINGILGVNSSLEDLYNLLPGKVKLFGSDGSEKEVDVVWDTSLITEDDLTHDNEIHIKGLTNSEEGSYEVEAIISVTGQVNSGISSISVITEIGQTPELPEKTTITDSSGNQVTSSVITWNEIPSESYSKIGSFKVYGTFDYNGKNVSVSATVRVINPISDEEKGTRNIALNAETSCSYFEGIHTADQLTDGIIGKGNGWGNWENHDTLRQDDWVSIKFNEVKTVNNANLLFLGSENDHAWIAPHSVKVEYLDSDGTWKEVSNIANNSGDAIKVCNNDDADNVRDFFTNITFDEVSTTELRFTMHFDNIDSIPHDNNGDNTMIKLSEIEVNIEDKYANSVSDYAYLGNIWIGLEELENFDPSVYSYSYALKSGQKVPNIYVDAPFNAKVTIINTDNPYGKATIIVISEDGLHVTTYEIQFTVVD